MAIFRGSDELGAMRRVRGTRADVHEDQDSLRPSHIAHLKYEDSEMYNFQLRRRRGCCGNVMTIVFWCRSGVP